MVWFDNGIAGFHWLTISVLSSIYSLSKSCFKGGGNGFACRHLGAFKGAE
jgi:hypothetical protein